MLFILVLLSTLSVYIAEDEYLALRRITNQRDAEQGYQMVIGAEQWIAKLLERDAAESDTDHPFEAWNNPLPQVGVEQGTLAAQVQDQQGLFNLNNLQAGRDSVWYSAFQRLLRVLALDEGLADAVVDWVDADPDVGGGNGAEDPQYLLEEPPYRAANSAFVDVGELAWVRGVEPETLAALAPYVTALPARDVPINVNTCPLPLLRILTNELLDEASAQALADGRTETGYASVTDFLVQPALAGAGDTVQPLVSVSSSFFRVTSTAQFGRLRLKLETLLERGAGSGAVVVRQRRRNHA